MGNTPFKKSKALLIGVELELQLIDNTTYDLCSRSPKLLQHLQNNPIEKNIKPEFLQSMLEINSIPHETVADLLKELLVIRKQLEECSKSMDTLICGGGLHHFATWDNQTVFPIPRYEDIQREYGYLVEHVTFGQHVHVGCSNGEDALYLTHALSHYVPHLIAMSASSPFVYRHDTALCSARAGMDKMYSACGDAIPYLTTWSQFSDYFNKMKAWGIIETMKDVYWDIRPKPEFGTVEIRVLDTPLTLSKVIQLTAYIQALAAYLLHERPLSVNEDEYYLYKFNRIQAVRLGLQATIQTPSQKIQLAQDILQSIKKIMPYAKQLDCSNCLLSLAEDIRAMKNDASLLRHIYKQQSSFEKTIEAQCRLWLL